MIVGLLGWLIVVLVMRPFARWLSRPAQRQFVAARHPLSVAGLWAGVAGVWIAMEGVPYDSVARSVAEWVSIFMLLLAGVTTWKWAKWR